MKRAGPILAAVIALCATSAHAEVKKFMRQCSGQLCPYYEIVLTPPEKWTEDKAATKANQVQVIVPRGKTFGNADALIYVKVSSRNQKQPLSEFIRVSQERWRQSVPDTRISALPAISRGNGKDAFESFRYENPSAPQQAFEVVSFGLDSDTDGNEFFVMVVLTGHSKKALEQAEKPYQTFLRTH